MDSRARALPAEAALGDLVRPGAAEATRAALAFVGDAVHAAAYRLAGARVFTPAPGGEGAALAQARAAAQVVLLSPEIAAAVERSDLDAALAALQPLAVLVPGDGGEISPFDPAERVRAQLGLER
jgi:vacuolar-type H+-ATPase subunit F/Vma7